LPISLLVLDSLRDAVGGADKVVFRAVNSGAACSTLDALMPVFTLAGVGYWQAGFCVGIILLGFVMKHADWRRAGYAGLIAFALSGVSVQIAKQLWARPRPLLAMYDVRIVGEPLFVRSFPSGHAITAFAVAVACSAFLPRGRYILIPLASLAAVSRVYLGVHFPLDVVFGSVIGALVGVCSARWIRPEAEASR